MDSQASEFTGFPSVVRKLDNIIHKAGKVTELFLDALLEGMH